MRCHYEVLEIARNADDDEIKKSYRKLALKWHPDKNPDKVQECTEYFALLQQAYEVLSDPHERAFYDRHRESFLKGGYDGDGLNDDEKGFFSVYRKVFDTLAAEDYDFIDSSETRYPSFGNSESDYDKVVGPFYGFWSSFSTARSYAWMDKYDIRQAPNRYIRDACRAERSEQVKELVGFIRKRDPRVKKYREILELRQLEAKKKQQENRRQQILKNQREMEEYMEDENAAAERQAHLEELSKQLAEDFGESCSEPENEEDDGLQCIVCNKFFKTANAKNNHEKSKQHKKQLADLRKHMRDEDAALFATEEVAEEEEKPAKKGKNKRRDRKKKSNIFGDDDENPEEADETLEEEKKTENAVEQVEEQLERLEVADTVEPEPPVEQKEKKKRRRADKSNPAASKEETEAEPVRTEPKTGRCDRCKEVFESRTKLF
ncbi:unnamed protein product [Caenorhabditis auriculariae]|uniref:DnaJ homolog subfamily C member 21 n=1 Tax=Caenorhabditis auriculariae TaxID=2777116 RepID=A0A8S1HU78_9PELO|nr:unnamed protein product [Caenorhabditis auriculariae]